MKIVSITGTKGKTTTLRIIDSLLNGMSIPTLRVDSDGHFINGKQKSNYEYSIKYWDLVPNVCPGRYLHEMKNLQFNDSQALLECAIGSSSLAGIGYNQHDVGLFTNILEDHITKRRIRNRDDIYKAKKFIFLKLRDNGTFVFNCTDFFLAKKLSKEKINQKKIAVGEKLLCFKLKEFLANGNIFFHIDQGHLYFTVNRRKITTRKKVLDFTKIPITFNGTFLPNVYNVAFSLSLLYCLIGEKAFFKRMSCIKKMLLEYKVDKHGGRLVFLENKKKDIKLIIDFAHEKTSLMEVAKLAKNFGKARVIGVLRIDPSRTRNDIIGTAKSIKNYYDFIYIYDKVDGIISKKSKAKPEGERRRIGETAKLFADGLLKAKYHSYKIILPEEEALKKACEESLPGDVIVYIGRGTNNRKVYEMANKAIKRLV